jgi:hypothetical protein
LTIQRLLTFGQTESVAGVLLELTHAKRRISGRSLKFWQRPHTGLTKWGLQFNLALKLILLKIGSAVGCASLRLGSFA